MPSTPCWLGIDVSKATFDAACARPGGGFAKVKLPRDRAGAGQLLAWARGQAEGRDLALVMEATGGYSKELAGWLRAGEAGLHVAIAQPFRVKHFAHAIGQRDKTDALDAAMLARFGAMMEPPAFHPLPPAYARLRALERERDALVREAVAMENRQELDSGLRLVQRTRARLLRHTRAAIGELEAAILTEIRSDAGLARDHARLLTIPGVGPVLASTLMGELGDLRAFGHPKQLAAFVGVAPVLRQSGSSLEGRPHMSKRGNGRVRRMLYMGALAAVRGDTPFRATYLHLRAQGKPPLSALGAIMRKLLVVCRGVLLHDEDYDPARVHKPDHLP